MDRYRGSKKVRGMEKNGSGLNKKTEGWAQLIKIEKDGATLESQRMTGSGERDGAGGEGQGRVRGTGSGERDGAG